MIAYNRQSLDNLDLQVEAREAFGHKLLSSVEFDRIRAAYPFYFYLPNFFIRVGLFVLTVIAAACGLGILLLMGLDSSWKTLAAILIIYGVLAYGALELFIHTRKMYGSGVDDALLWIASLLIVLGINFSAGDILRPVPNCAIILTIAVLGMLRYADRVMTLVAYGAFLGLIFYGVGSWGPVARALLPFLVIGLSIGCYFLFTRLYGRESLRHYRLCLLVLRVASLLSLYAAGNYYIVRQLNEVITGRSDSFALGWLWWLLTAIVPGLYIVKGVQKKEALFLWTGMALTAGSVFTVRYYYHWLATEDAMIIAGGILIAGVYGLIRFLRKPKHGFTVAAPDHHHALTDLPVEGVIIAESFSAVAAQPADTGTRFGGGTTGGGGAGGQY
jgi:hypothetical protein